MMLSNTQIERLAVGAVTTAAHQPGSYLNADIPVGDKGISFDGSISVFRDGSEKKESLVGIVPVQVKGNTVDHFHEENRSFSLEMAHYRNYLNSDGALLLVVDVKMSGATKIFYKSLLGMELTRIIEKYGHQKTKSVELRPLEETNLYSVCRKFLSEKEHQPKVLVKNNLFPKDSFQAYTLTSLTYNPTHTTTSSIFEHDFTIYGMANNIRIPLDIGRIQSLGTAGLTRFEVNGHSYDFRTKISVEEDKTILILEEVFSITIEQSNMKLHFRFLGFHSLAAQLQVIPFLNDMFAGHPVQFAGSFFEITQGKELQDELQSVKQLHREIEDASILFKHLGIQNNTVFNEAKDADDLGLILYLLTKSINQKKLVGIKIKDPESTKLINVELGDKSVLVYYNPKGDLLISNGYGMDMLELRIDIQFESGDTFPHSVYTMLSVDTLAKAVNLNPETLKRSFDHFDPYETEAASNWTNQFCLRCINAFDLSGNTDLLEVADHLYQRARSSNPPDPVKIINRLQIKKRIHGSLREEDNEILIQLKLDGTKQDNLELVFCTNVLLANKMEANSAYRQFEKEKKEFYEDLPIFKLLKDL
ncbi:MULTISPECIES: DUF4365 domain-containing protein [unclassified Paenibacillus]|uniref:DUF4365 domain-containing protein n=1 Tax=unclassified Paenibacillus TaxID=185978 RepID=UPI002780FC38|nr:MULTISPECIES: DUF4365 domain-containing protein [unclassified Paenibacillus]MDQ0896219.1 hypothetical protein [Paenibacillus sp. V4I7]MDQ0913965.1 hypothetical protein [Paenibacillus sp. V4I5]